MSLYAVSSQNISRLDSAQVSTASEAELIGTTIDLSQTLDGQFFYILFNQGASVILGLQTSVDGVTWLDSTVTGASLAMDTVKDYLVNNTFFGSSGLVSLRFVRLSIVDFNAGTHGAVQVLGGFAA